MVESLKWSAEVVCSVYHVPPYKVGVGALPSYNNVQALNVEYYSARHCRATSRKSRSCSTTGSVIGGWAGGMGTEFDTENLLRMDSITLVTTIRDAVGAGVMSPNEGRAKFDLKPVDGRQVAIPSAAELLARGAGQARRAGRSVQAGNATNAATATGGRGQAGRRSRTSAAKDIAAQFTRALQAVHREAGMMDDNDITELAKGMVPFVRDCVAEATAVPPELAEQIASCGAHAARIAGHPARGAATIQGHSHRARRRRQLRPGL